MASRAVSRRGFLRNVAPSGVQRAPKAGVAPETRVRLLPLTPGRSAGNPGPPRSARPGLRTESPGVKCAAQGFKSGGGLAGASVMKHTAKT